VRLCSIPKSFFFFSYLRDILEWAFELAEWMVEEEDDVAINIVVSLRKQKFIYSLQFVYNLLLNMELI
jgi:hypothetical protein